MKDIYNVDENYIIITILKIKQHYFIEKFVTFKELNTIKQALRNECYKRNLNVYFENEINKDYFMNFDNVIVLNQNYSNNEAEKYFQSCYSYLNIEILSLLWNEQFIYQSLLKMKKREYEKLFLENEKNKKLLKTSY